MTTLAEAHAAPKVCQQQRFGLRHLLKVNEHLATADDLALAERGRAATTPERFDAFIADTKVCALFCSGVFYFGALQL